MWTLSCSGLTPLPFKIDRWELGSCPKIISSFLLSNTTNYSHLKNLKYDTYPVFAFAQMGTKTYVDSCIIHLHTLHRNEWQLRMHFIMDHWFTITVCFLSFWPNNIIIVGTSFFTHFLKYFCLFALIFVGFLLWANNISVQTVHCIWQQFRMQCKVNNAGKADTILLGKRHLILLLHFIMDELKYLDFLQLLICIAVRSAF